MFIPPARYLPNSQVYVVQCDAIPPTVGIKIGGQMFYTDPSSMILSEVREEASGMCLTGVGDTSGPPYILGDTFMQGLVSVFDISEKMEIRFAKRL
jgi:hypothetical protein